jgi:hypothetical protein
MSWPVCGLMLVPWICVSPYVAVETVRYCQLDTVERWSTVLCRFVEVRKSNMDSFVRL